VTCRIACMYSVRFNSKIKLRCIGEQERIRLIILADFDPKYALLRKVGGYFVGCEERLPFG
jgi:hypothetical protein